MIKTQFLIGQHFEVCVVSNLLCKYNIPVHAVIYLFL